MKKYSIEDLKQEGWFDHYDGDIFIMDDIRKLPLAESSIFETEILLVIICESGAGEINVNDRLYRVGAGQMLVCMPHALFKDYRVLTDDFNVFVLGLSTRNFNLSLFSNRNVWKTFYYIYANPLVSLSEHDKHILSLYYQLAEAKIRCRDDVYHKEIVNTLLLGVVYELLSVIDRSDGGKLEAISLGQGDILFRRFTELLAKYDGKMRSVAAFAAELCVSPKYLSSVVKASCGRTALELIHESSTRAIMRQLKYSDKSIKEISNEMGFSSLSFFGKFVKSQLGVSPKKFRREV